MENSKIKLTIGEFSKLCFVTVKTLRHYEKVGVLMPREVDPWSHYRYYNVSQMHEMNHIKTLKTLGFTLDEIKEFIDDNGQITPEMIQRALSQANHDLDLLRQRISALKQMSGELTQNFELMKQNIVIKPLAGGTVASFSKVLKSYDELGPLCCGEIYNEMMRLECVCPQETAYCFTVDHNKNYDPTNIDLEYCEVVSSHNNLPSDIIKFKQIPVVEKAVCFSHYGDYQSFGESMSVIMNYIESHKLKIASDPRFCYIHGAWDCDNAQDWLTEIQVPVQ